MEVKSGEVKALVNMYQNEDGTFTENKNGAVSDQVEPGSTFKTFSLIALIDELKASIAETEAKSLDLGKQASDIYEEIVKLQEKAKALNAEKEQVDIQISQVNAEIEGIRKENNEFKSYM
jgi:cell division protein FtsI/penicillin-binding protein 2